MNLVDIPILVVLAAVIALIVRGMLRGSIKTCDSSSCSGNCGSCSSQCDAPRIKLSREQIAQLDALTKQATEARP